MGCQNPPPPPTSTKNPSPASRATCPEVLPVGNLCVEPSLRKTLKPFANASLPPCNPQGAQMVRSIADCTLPGERNRTSCATPSPPRNFPGPPESCRNLRYVIKIGPLPSPASTGVLCVSPSLIQKVAFWPSRSLNAPQPPPERIEGK